MKSKALLLAVAVGLLYGPLSHAQPAPGGGGSSNPLLNHWAFSTTNWLAADGCAPLAFTNLILNNTGDGGISVLIDSTNTALLQYPIVETNGNTNLVISGDGTFSVWFNPSWSNDDQSNGYGPAGWGRLLEIGAYTTNADEGWFSLFLSPDGQNIYLSAEDTNGFVTNYLAAPVSWTAGSWHQLVLTYSLTNSCALYCDGVLLTNGDPLSILPGPVAISNGFFLGSDSTGSPTNQAHGAFDDLYTYSTALDSNSVRGFYGMMAIPIFGVTNFESSAPYDSELPTETNTFLAVTGLGYLQWAGAASNVTTGGQVYITNPIAVLSSNFSMVFNFSIAGGTNGIPYDVFGTTALTSGGVASNAQWYWLGQGYTSNTYILTNQPSLTAFYILGTPQDSAGAGLSDAYQSLVTHTDVDDPDPFYTGLGTGWLLYNGINPLNPTNVPNVRLGYWRFNTNSWIGEEGQLPLLASDIALVPSWSSNAVQVDNASPANLSYAAYNTNCAMQNIDCKVGTVRFWINPDWSSGTGPGAFASLLEVGDDTGTGGYWALTVSADGTQLFFETETNRVTTFYFTNSISWTSNAWHQVALTYSPGTNGATTLYVDGAQAASGPAIVSWPSQAGRTANGLNIGSSQIENGQSRAVFDELETFNYPLSANDISNDYAGIFSLNPLPYISYTNSYVATTNTTVTLTGDAGAMAVLVDSTNFASAAWTIYNTNVQVNLGTNQGWHQVWIGLRALPTNAQPVWQLARFNLDQTPPQVVITSPTNSSTFLPTIQILGYSPEPLACLAYDLINSAGAISNQPFYVSSQFYDTNFYAFTTNSFQLYDLDLAAGTNTVCIHATDRAGNTTTTNFSFVFDLSGDTNAPAITLYWPQNNAQISGTNFTLRGSLNNPTAAVTVQIVDTNSNTNVANGIVERNGNFWVQNLPLSPGSNMITLIATDAATNWSSTNFCVVGSMLQLAIDPIGNGSLTTPPITVTGEINSSAYTVWVNGVKATLNGDGTWGATGVPFNDGGVAIIQARAIPNSDNGGNGTADPNAGSPTMSDSGNPNSTGATDTSIQPYIGPYYRVTSYNFDNEYDYAPSAPAAPVISQIFSTNWTPGGGTSLSVIMLDDGSADFEEVTYPPSLYPPSADGNEHSWVVPYGLDSYDTVGPCAIQCWHMGSAMKNTGTNPDGTPFSVDVSYNADTRIELVTGGMGVSHRKDLFVISGSAYPMSWWLKYGTIPTLPPAAGTNVDYTKITMGSLGQLGSDGRRYIVLAENSTQDATPSVSGCQNYSFDAGASAYTYNITANGVDLSTNTPEFCVGQNVSFQLNWDSTPPGLVDTLQNWTLPDKYVNQPTNYNLYCTTYVLNGDLLTNNPTSCWYVNKPGGAVSVWQNLHFANGQYVTIAANGNIAIYVPTVSSFTRIANDAWWSAPKIYAQISWQVGVTSTYDGEYGFTQLLNSINLAYDTGGLWFLDGSSEIYGEQGTSGPSPYRTDTSSTWILHFLDTPYSLAAPCVNMNINFQDYLRFQPSGPSNIFVTIATNGWFVNASACLWSGASATNCPPAAAPVPSDQFPIWVGQRSGQ